MASRRVEALLFRLLLLLLSSSCLLASSSREEALRHGVQRHSGAAAEEEAMHAPVLRPFRRARSWKRAQPLLLRPTELPPVEQNGTPPFGGAGEVCSEIQPLARRVLRNARAWDDNTAARGEAGVTQYQERRETSGGFLRG
ncbi:hypothetical protein OPV22_012787 [Ensete ventricosum]|uniref:Uncharacterized protein n=1 Tax=Ensete ventricosum TaxID=4639 RepID=A0AAV8R3F8_ENSVE|nr:hypothetical protein OPV22_012787 [Ensete ventricosum]